jgi:branched-chain amino acid transport system substrate-binding protein
MPDSLVALWSDGMRLLADAIVRAGSTEPTPLRSAIASTTGFGGITGKISLDSQRNASKPGVIIAIENQQLKVAERVSP